MPLIDVIVPVYKVEEYLPKCVESLLAQDFDDYVITLVDDGSPDNCPALCDQYAAENPGRIRVIHQANGGLSMARNVAVAASEAELVTFVDSDDHVSEQYLSALYGAFAAAGADMAFSTVHSEYMQPDGTVSRSPYPILGRAVFDRDQALAELCLEQGMSGCAWGKLLSRECALAHPFPPGRLFEDSFTVYRQVMDCEKIAYAPEATYYYLQRPDGIQHRKFEPRHMDLLDAAAEMMDVFRTADMPPAVMAAGAYKVCRACYVTAYHAAGLPFAEYRAVCGKLVPLLRAHFPAARDARLFSFKDHILLRLLATCRALFYLAVKLKA